MSYRLNLSSKPVYVPYSKLADKLKNIQFTAGYIQAIIGQGVHKSQKAMWNKKIQVYGHLNFQVRVPYIFPI